MRNTFLYLFLLPAVTCCVLPSCKKGELIAGKSNGSLKVELLGLPNTPAMDIYFKGKLLDSVFPGTTVGILPMIVVVAGDTGIVAFTRHNTQEVLLDTAVTVPAEQMLAFRLAWSEALGVKDFMTEGSAVHADSCKMRFFNQLEGLLPEGVEADLCLFRFNYATADYDEVHTFPSFARGKLTEEMITVPVVDAQGTTQQYILRLRDRATGTFLQDEFPFTNINMSLPGGAYVICIVDQVITRRKNLFHTQMIPL
jgi:hypothetical protein